MKYCDNCHSAYPDDFTICPRDQGSLRYASELVPGVVIRGKYEILEKVGTGGMATVYRARHLAFRRPARVDGQAVQGIELAAEVVSETAADVQGIGVAGPDRPEARAQNGERVIAAVGERQGA